MRSDTTSLPSAATAASALAGLSTLHPETIMMLRAARSASPSARRLVLGTAPAAVRATLISTGVCVDRRGSGGPVCDLTELGAAVVQLLPDLTGPEREHLRRTVDRRLSEASAGRVR